jgi:F-type H+-transporting ATPase subunit delta
MLHGTFVCPFVYYWPIILQAVRANLQEAQRVASSNASEEDKLEAQIEVEVYESLQHALSS